MGHYRGRDNIQRRRRRRLRNERKLLKNEASYGKPATQVQSAVTASYQGPLSQIVPRNGELFAYSSNPAIAGIQDSVRVALGIE